MKPGIYTDLTNEQYHAADGIGNSGLTIIANRTPAHYLASRAKPRHETPAMAAGTRLHAAILEPATFAQRYAPIEQHDKRTKDGKVYWEQWQLENAGKIPVTPQEQDQTLAILESLSADPAVRELLTGGHRERSIFANDPETGVLVKCRPDNDLSRAHRRTLVDVKSTEDASAEAFQWSAYKYGYWRQAAFYMDVCAWAGELVDDFFILAFEKEAPYGHMIYQASPRFLARGREAYRMALNTYAECLSTGNWPCYEPGVHSIDLPEVIHKRMEAADNDEVMEIGYV